MSDSVPEGAFTPAVAKLGQILSEASGELRPEYFIEIAFEPFEYEDEEHQPLLRINGLGAGVRSWKALSGLELENPDLDASVQMFYEQNPMEITKLKFGDSDGDRLRISFDVVIDFEMEAGSELGELPLSLDRLFDVGGLTIGTSIEKRCRGDAALIIEEVKEAFDTSEYGSLEKVHGGYEFTLQ